MNEEQLNNIAKSEIPSVEETDWKDKYFRALAEMENMRKRMQKERQEVTRFAIENAIGEFLPVIDNFETALRLAKATEGDVKNWAIGFEMMLSQFKEVLQGHGIFSFHSEGTTFDAQLHEAVEIIETTDFPDKTIIQEFTKGYKSDTRTLRPARVKVAKNSSAPKSESVTPDVVSEEKIN